MNGTDHFKRTIQAYLDSRAAEDKLFAASYSKPNKNMDDCITYLLHWAKSQCNGGNGIGVTAQGKSCRKRYTILTRTTSTSANQSRAKSWYAELN